MPYDIHQPISIRLEEVITENSDLLNGGDKINDVFVEKQTELDVRYFKCDNGLISERNRSFFRLENGYLALYSNSVVELRFNARGNEWRSFNRNGSGTLRGKVRLIIKNNILDISETYEIGIRVTCASTHEQVLNFSLPPVYGDHLKSLTVKAYVFGTFYKC